MEQKTREKVEKMILDHWTKEALKDGWVAEHLKYNYMKEQKEELEEKINKAIEFVEQNLEGIGYVEVCDLLDILTGDNNDR